LLKRSSTSDSYPLDVPGNLKRLRQELHPGECATHKALADAIAEEP
jgi:hypothetical protein